MEQDLLGEGSWVTVSPASMTSILTSFVLLNAEAVLAAITLGRCLCLSLLNVLVVPRGSVLLWSRLCPPQNMYVKTQCGNIWGAAFGET